MRLMVPTRVPLVQLPTPCHRLDRLSNRLGADLWIKRDDLTGFAMGGNKGRKLEYLMAEALASGADTVVSCGAAQSNFIRQLGAACAVLDLNCHAVVMALPYAAAHGKPSFRGSDSGGNVLLDDLLGVCVKTVPDDDWEVLYQQAEELADDLEAADRKVYRIPIGGSSSLGAFAFFEAARELTGEFDTIVTPSSSGSTHAGLAYAFKGTKTRVIGVASDPEPEIMEDLVRLAHGLDGVTGLSKNMTEADFDLRLDWAGEAYGVPSPGGQAAIGLLAKSEGIFLDPVYTGKAFAGLLDLVEIGNLGRVVFWHTGGLPTLFAE